MAAAKQRTAPILHLLCLPLQFVKSADMATQSRAVRLGRLYYSWLSCYLLETNEGNRSDR